LTPPGTAQRTDKPLLLKAHRLAADLHGAAQIRGRGLTEPMNLMGIWERRGRKRVRLLPRSTL
jgi:hypothetical protein